MRLLATLALAGALFAVPAAPAQACPPPLGCPVPKVRPDRPGGFSGLASMYGTRRDGYAGRRTASGERMQPAALTAAHRTLPFGTLVRVVNRRNEKSVVVRINDRGPFVRGRVIDLSAAAARAIGMSGLAPVRLERL